MLRVIGVDVLHPQARPRGAAPTERYGRELVRAIVEAAAGADIGHLAGRPVTVARPDGSQRVCEVAAVEVVHGVPALLLHGVGPGDVPEGAEISWSTGGAAAPDGALEPAPHARTVAP